MFQSTNFKIIAGMVAFFSLAVGVTTGMIIAKNDINSRLRNENFITSGDIENISGEQTIADETKPSNYYSIEGKELTGIDLKGTYDTNDIVLTKNTYEEGNASVEYYQIDGLKNKNVEYEINQKLKEHVTDMLEEIRNNKNLQDTKSVKITSNLVGNFANIISVEASASIYLNTLTTGGYNEYRYYSKYLNLELVNGSEITLSDVFIDTSYELETIKNECYEELAWADRWKDEEALYEQEEPDYDSFYANNRVDVDEIELYRRVTRYKNHEMKDFCISPVLLRIRLLENSDNPESSLLTSHDSFWIYIEDAADKIAIYDRYITKESIYENDDIGVDEIYNISMRCATSDYYEIYDVHGNLEDNLYVDAQISIDQNAGESAKTVFNNYIQKINEEIETEKQYARENKNKKIFFNKVCRINKDGDVIISSSASEKYETEREYFDNVFEDKMIGAYRNMFKEYDMAMYVTLVYVPTYDDENVIVESKNENHRYSVKDPTLLLEKLENYFVPEYDYKTIFKQELNNRWNQKYGYYLAEEELEKQYEKTTFSYGTRWDYNNNGEIAGFTIDNSMLGYSWASENFININLFDREQMTV